jgi:hypothetical protein
MATNGCPTKKAYKSATQPGFIAALPLDSKKVFADRIIAKSSASQARVVI